MKTNHSYLHPFLNVPALLVLLGLWLATPARAAVLFHTDFADGTMQDWSTFSLGTAVVGAVSHGGGYALKVDDTKATSSNLQVRRGFTQQSTGELQLDLNLQFDNTGGSGTNYNGQIRISLRESANDRAATWLEARQGDGFFVRQSNGDYLDTGVAILPGSQYKVTLTLDLDAQRWGWSIANLSNPSPEQSASGSGLAFYTKPLVGLDQVQIQRISGSNQGLYFIDEATLQTIPEPSTAWLLGITVGLSLASKRLFSHAAGTDAR